MRKGKTAPRISSITFYKHRFKKALQLFGERDQDPVEAYAKLKKQSAVSNMKCAKTAGWFVVAAVALIFSIETGQLTVTTSFFSFSIPSVYLLFVSALIWVGFTFSLITVFQFIAFSDAFKSYFGRYKKDYEMLVFLEDVEIEDFMAPPYHDSFLKPSGTAFSIRSLIYLVLICAGLLPVAAGQYYASTYSLSIVRAVDSVPLHKSLAIASIVLTATSTMYLLSAFIPFKTTKQIGLIRWVFLHRLRMKHFETRHPQSSYWLKEEETHSPSERIQNDANNDA
ncbi:hypothetical protein PVV74_15355 [Roseovarius sp. SK2]|uniref:hypothetical protein n=1 Tax=Roseovarius TaxID=74030 RepID=UPI00237B6677|nr:hypothetical protein [Roseovarius sp. SK2]MDD9726836.1 hypothetical protein [Roseovarius sp. SK2]